MDEAISVVRVTGRAHFAAPWRKGATASLCLCLRGELAFDVDGQTLRVEQGALCVMRHDTRDVTRLVRASADADVVFVGVQRSDAEQDITRIAAADVARHPTLSSLVSLLSRELARDAGSRLVGHLGASLLLAASRGAADDHAKDARVEKAIDEMRAHPRRAHTVASLARRVGLSRAAFARRFLAATGKSPARFLMEQRLALAAARLTESDDSLAEIADAVGYATEFAFGRAFKRYFGEAPGRYRRRAQRTFAPTMRIAA